MNLNMRKKNKDNNAYPKIGTPPLSTIKPYLSSFTENTQDSFKLLVTFVEIKFSFPLKLKMQY